MALARVVTFDGIGSERMQELAREMQEGDDPENLPATELLVLHDPDSETAIAVVFFETEEDYRVGHETLDAMPAEDVPGRRTSVAKYDVAVRRSM